MKQKTKKKEEETKEKKKEKREERKKNTDHDLDGLQKRVRMFKGWNMIEIVKYECIKLKLNNVVHGLMAADISVVLKKYTTRVKQIYSFICKMRHWIQF